MQKVISFSLWGDKPIYLVGAIRNAIIAKHMYPDFTCWFYIHKHTVPLDVIDKLNQLDNTRIIYKHDLSKPRTWRFEPIDDPNVQVMLSRDTDTQILLREKLAVDEWLNSDKALHIMRDHPHHSYQIQAGMFGVKKTNVKISWTECIIKYCVENTFDYDQVFLKDVIYPMYTSRMIHASFNRFEGDECLEFPIPHDEDDYRFVGEYVYEDESRNAQHTQIIRSAQA